MDRQSQSVEDLAMVERWERECLATDPFAGDFGEVGDKTLRDKMVTARKGGICHDCCGEITPGSRVRSRADIFDGELMHFRWCEPCCRAQALSWTDDGKAWEARITTGHERRLAALRTRASHQQERDRD
jgi:hypothetical protein